MSGLRSTFSRPRKKYGATANNVDGGDSPSNKHLFTPPVSGFARQSISELENDEGTKLWHVTYGDFDGEDLTREELVKVLVPPIAQHRGGFACARD